MKQQPHAVPQHNRGKGWLECQPHQAQAWAAFLGARLLGRYGSKARALEVAANAMLRKAGPTRRYELGLPMPSRAKTEAGTYASSLTTEQYNQLQRKQQRSTPNAS